MKNLNTNNTIAQVNKINTLTSIRFFAILMIVISHLEFLGNYNIAHFYNMYLHNPTLGVDVFFVLSGFGQMYSSFNKQLKFKFINIDYAIQHIKKLYSLYMLTMLVCVPLCIFWALQSGRPLINIIHANIIKLIATSFLVQSLFGITWLSHAYNSVCWFLSCLFLIYIVCPFLICFLKKYCNKIKILISLLILIPIFQIVLFYILEATHCLNFNEAPFARISYVILGMVIAMLFKKQNSIVKNINLYEIAILILAIVWFIYRNTFFINYYFLKHIIYLIDMNIVSLIIYIFAMNQGCISGILNNPKFIQLGDMSMYIFLIHYPIRLYIAEICSLCNLHSDFIVIMQILIIFVSTYFLSKFLYKKHKQNYC